VAIVDIYPIFSDGVAKALEGEPDFVVVGRGTSAEEAIRFARDNTEVLLIEAAVPGALRVAQTVLRDGNKTKVVFLAASENFALATQAIRLGVQGYIIKGVTGSELVKALRGICNGEKYVTPDLAWHLVTQPPVAEPKGAATYGTPLTVREQLVLDKTTQGLTNQEIANSMGLAVSTIKYYKLLAFRKIGVRNRLEALARTSKLADQT
jgi:DNA-binding NarL/FixJ family response regulator